MEYTTFKSATKCLWAALFLLLGTFSAHAQYYLNIRQTDGTRLRYAVSAVDSVWFDQDEQQEPSGNYEYVDLGLSVNWATFNVGATKPEEYGDYYAWGEIETKSDYSWATYKWCNVSDNTLTKYCDNSDYGDEGFTDTLIVLSLEDDIAHVKWGGSWRMPTQTEINELRNNCTWTWTTQNGVNGYLVTSKISGHEGASLFLPAAGQRYDTDLYNVGSCGDYWSSSLSTSGPYYAYDFYFSSDVRNPGGTYRYCGQSVRPVCPSSTYTTSVDDVVVSIELNPSQVSMTVGYAPIQITATPRNGNGDAVTVGVDWSTSDAAVAEVAEDGTVNPVGAGSCTITASVGDVQSTCVVTVSIPLSEASGYENGYGYVDLGLSVNWATFNVGASSPEEYGDYYAWGEIETKTDYSWATYKWCNGSDTTLTKYSSRSNYGNEGFTDTLTVLTPEDDIAHVKWGDSWRMPTKAEQDELRNSCTWTWYSSGNIEFNGIAGYKVTSKVTGYTDQSIFLPVAGCRTGTGFGGVFGDYWSSSLNIDTPYHAYYLYFDSGVVSFYDIWNRYTGRSVRPVCSKETPNDNTPTNTITSVTLDTTSLTLKVGDEYSLKATAWSGNEEVDTATITWKSDNESVTTVSIDGLVKAISAGTTTITVSSGDISITCSVSVYENNNGSSNGYEYVDLGLSVKWATCNVGASSPEEYGDYYGWGETGSKSSYSWSNYKYCNGSSYTLTKYNNSSSYGTVDDITTLDESDDIAHVKWGGTWRMPTIDECIELLNNCTWTWTTQNGVEGCKVTSNISGYTDCSIFLPAAGDLNGENHYGAGSRGLYWPSSLYPSRQDYAWCLDFNQDNHSTNNCSRRCGLSVRPVCPKDTPNDPTPTDTITSVTLDDWSAPALESFTIIFPSTSEVDVTEAPQTIVFRAHLTDASGVDRLIMDVFNTSSNGTVGKSSFAPEFTLVSGDEKDGVYEATLVLDAETRPGSYQCDLKVWDILGNTPFGLNVVGRVKFTVINNAGDFDAPILESFTITTPSSTSEVDVTEAPQTIVFRAHLTDASGVDRLIMDVFNTSSNGTVGKSSFAPEFTLVSGDEKDGVYEATLVLDAETRPGSYQCDLKVWDILGNTPFGSNVVGRVKFTVINNAGDFDAPILESFTITTPSSTSEVDVTEAPQTIVFRAHLTDASGVDRLIMDVFNTSSNGTVGKSSFAPEFTLVSGDEKDGVYEATLLLDAETRPGSYQCDLKVWDILGNTPFGLNVVGRVKFTVINNN